MKSTFKCLVLVIFLFIYSGKGGESFAQSWQWFNKMGGVSSGFNPDEKVNDMVVDSTGNVFVVGEVLGGASFGGVSYPLYGGQDGFLAKYDCAGNLLWVRVIGSTMSSDECRAITLDDSGHIYITGIATASSNNPWNCGDTALVSAIQIQQFYIAKFDTLGDFYWARVTDESINLGTSTPQKIRVDSNGDINVLILCPDNFTFQTGFTTDTIASCSIVQYNSQGSVVDLRLISPFYSPLYYKINDYEIVDSSNNYYIICSWSNTDSLIIGDTVLYQQLPMNRYDLILAKLDSSDSIIWITTKSHTTDGYYGSGLTVSSSGISILTQAPRDVIFGTDTLVNSYNFSLMPLIISYDDTGNYVWAEKLSAQSITLPSSITLKNQNELAIAGAYNGNLILGNDTINTGAGIHDIFLGFVSTTGTPAGLIKLPGTGSSEQVFCMAADNNENIYIGGAYDGTMEMNGNVYPFSGGYSDGFIAKYGTICTVGINEITTVTENYISIYPNPVSDYLTVNSHDKQLNTIFIYNILGETVLQKNINQNKFEEFQLNVAALPTGIYFLKAFGNNFSVAEKFIKD